MRTEPLVLDLHDPRATDPGLAGAKAANLARAGSAGLPVIPGFVLTTAAFDPASPGWPGAPLPEDVTAALRAAWLAVVAPDPEGVALVVRSSSTVEDVDTSSMAGQFRSCLDVVGWTAFEEAVRQVLGSSTLPVGTGPPAPMAALVQRQVAARVGGVLFGLDPVTGDRSHVLVEAVPGGPESLVSGTVTAQRYLLGRRGRLIEGPPEPEQPALLDRHARTRLARLAARTATQFGRAQDVEWAIDTADTLWLLQSRPVTAIGSDERGTGPLLGPGPVGETFPDPLHPLEEDLWLEPLRSGIRSALSVVGARPRRMITASPLVTTVDGRVACDLDLLGASPLPPSGWRWLDPRVPARRLASAWRVGRLRAVLPDLAGELCQRVDGELAGLGRADHRSPFTPEQLAPGIEPLGENIGIAVAVSLPGNDRPAAPVVDQLGAVLIAVALARSDHDLVPKFVAGTVDLLGVDPGKPGPPVLPDDDLVAVGKRDRPGGLLRRVAPGIADLQAVFAPLGDRFARRP